MTNIVCLAAALLTLQSGPAPVKLPHFPDTVHAVVWRNWGLVPRGRMAKVLHCKPSDITSMAARMGMPPEPVISPELEQRTYLTVIRRNWHLMPESQITELLNWTPERLKYTLKEDDFLYIKLGSLKPNCPPVVFVKPDQSVLRREQEIASVTRESLAGLKGLPHEAPFHFLKTLTLPVPAQKQTKKSLFHPRFCYSYFATYGDPFAPGTPDPYPDNYLSQLANTGVDGIWLQAVLYKLAPFPWAPEQSKGWQDRIANLKKLIARAKKHNIGVYLYLNEPRTIETALAQKLPGISGVREGDQTSLCTSVPSVQNYIINSIQNICKSAPDLAGFFTITASENLTNCWSHGQGKQCDRCSKRTPAEVISEVNNLIQTGINQSGAKTKLIAWDWGWNNDWAPEAISKLKPEVGFMSVSEWDLPIERGGVKSNVGEYSLSSVGPGPRAQRHWELANKVSGRSVLAKVQSNTSWEIGTVPYVPAVYLAAQHAVNLRKAKVNGLMLSWTLGGFPSPNLMAFDIAGTNPNLDVDSIVKMTAEKWTGSKKTEPFLKLWRGVSDAFQNYPYHIETLYNSPVQLGPANLLWLEPTGYHATMAGFPYDDLRAWRGPYPSDVFASQMEKTADGFQRAVEGCTKNSASTSRDLVMKLLREICLTRMSEIHFRSVAAQTRFIVARENPAGGPKRTEELLSALGDELKNSLDLLSILWSDSRIGFEASNQYAYVWQDLVEKQLNCLNLISVLKRNR